MKKIKKIKKIVTMALFMCLINMNQIMYAKGVVGSSGADKLADSVLGKGLTNLGNDAGKLALTLSPIIGGACAIYFFIRKNMADEMDQKQWSKRIMVTGISTVGAVIVSAMITVLTGYFK